MSSPPHPAILRYSQGEISARQAADLLGGDATVHDVIYKLRQAGLEPPRQPREVELAELKRAMEMLHRLDARRAASSDQQ